MSTDPDPQVTIDATRVALSEPWTIDYWTETFGVSEARLRKAVKEVGPMVTEVRRYLARQASIDSAGR